MKIRQPVINTFDRCEIPYKMIETLKGTRKATNRFTGEIVETTPLLSYLVDWVYMASNLGVSENNKIGGKIRISDFDRIRYFILEQDKEVYSVCID